MAMPGVVCKRVLNAMMATTTTVPVLSCVVATVTAWPTNTSTNTSNVLVPTTTVSSHLVTTEALPSAVIRRGGACSDGEDNNYAAGLVCGRTNDYDKGSTFTCCKHYNRDEDCHEATCQGYGSVTTKLLMVGSSHDIQQKSNTVTPWTLLLGLFLGLAMFATFKIAKDYHHRHQEQYNQLE